MIIVRSPLRITLAGGGTDLPSFYNACGYGDVISAAINKYVYVTVMRPFVEGIFLKYSEIEKCKTVDEVKHSIIREVLRMADLKTPQIEITTLADIPSGTGLGSSSSFTTALIKAIYTHRNKQITQETLANEACFVEIDKLGNPIGKQDQYISACGGITEFLFYKSSTKIIPVSVPFQNVQKLENNLLLFFTGFSRDASSILKDQDKKTKAMNDDMLRRMMKVRDNVHEIRKVLLGNIDDLGSYFHEHWMEKRLRSPGMSNERIDFLYEKALRNGSSGGKIVGAGGGGFLLLYASNPEQLRWAMANEKIEEVKFAIDFLGTSVV